MTQHHFDNGDYGGPYSKLTITDGTRELTLSSCSDLEPGQILRETILAPILRGSTLDPAELRIATTTAFALGGLNTAAAIKSLKDLNANPLAELERGLRPRIASTEGFLTSDEFLIQILLSDNATVIDQLGLTHQLLAEPLLTAQKIWQKAGYSRQVDFSVEGRHFRFNGVDWPGMRRSKFGHRRGINADYLVTNLETGSNIKFSGAVPELIHSYGFYEVHGTHYRVDPRDVLKVFDYLRD